MTESAESEDDVSLGTSIPVGAVSLESILRTEELHRRPWRPPDYEKENRALVALVSALADSPRTILQTLAEKVLEVLQADSSGLSLLTKDKKRFYWAAIAGAWQPHIGGGTPRNFGPCGDVLDRNVPMLFTHWELRYPYLRPAISGPNKKHRARCWLRCRIPARDLARRVLTVRSNHSTPPRPRAWVWGSRSAGRSSMHTGGEYGPCPLLGRAQSFSSPCL